MGLSDKTPESYTQSISEGSQPSSKELQDFQKILEGHQVDMLINNVQKADDATNILTGTAHNPMCRSSTSRNRCRPTAKA